MGRAVRNLLVIGVVVATAIGAAASAATTPLPTEFTSGGVRWGDLTDDDGFYNQGSGCSGADGFAMSDAELLATGQDDAFDDAGVVLVDGVTYAVPGGVNGPVDLSGTTLATPLGPAGPLNVSVQWQAAGPGTIREMVTLVNPGATDFTGKVFIDTELGSDEDTTLQASSTGDISGYPSTARWFVTSEGDSEPTSDPVIISVAAGPGSIESPDTVSPCPVIPDSADADADKAGATDGETGDATTTTGGEVTASGTPLGTDTFRYTYNVTVPAGQTRYIMVFWVLYETIAQAVAAAPTWNTNPADGSAALGLLPAPPTIPGEFSAGATASATATGDVSALAGLTATQLSQIVNWVFAPTPMQMQPRFTG